MKTAMRTAAGVVVGLCAMAGAPAMAQAVRTERTDSELFDKSVVSLATTHFWTLGLSDSTDPGTIESRPAFFYAVSADLRTFKWLRLGGIVDIDARSREIIGYGAMLGIQRFELQYETGQVQWTIDAESKQGVLNLLGDLNDRSGVSTFTRRAVLYKPRKIGTAGRVAAGVGWASYQLPTAAFVNATYEGTYWWDETQEVQNIRDSYYYFEPAVEVEIYGLAIDVAGVKGAIEDVSTLPRSSDWRWVFMPEARFIVGVGRDRPGRQLDTFLEGAIREESGLDQPVASARPWKYGWGVESETVLGPGVVRSVGKRGWLAAGLGASYRMMVNVRGNYELPGANDPDRGVATPGYFGAPSLVQVGPKLSIAGAW